MTNQPQSNRTHHAPQYIVAIVALVLAFTTLPGPVFSQAASSASGIKIGIIGSGNLGGTLGTLWAKSGHPVLFSSRHPEELKKLVDSLGPLARAGTVREALAFGDVYRCALIVMAVILAILLQAIVAPLVLLASVVLSFACTLGISILIIRFVVGDAGFDSSIPVFAFIFLVALGIDYTIFLMARVREEARRHGTREGMLRALAATGPVITSAGVILAGTFSVLMTLPVTFTFDLGLMVALGILLDTFIVRTIMVPAAVELIGDRVWWPSTARAGGGTGWR